MNIAFVIQGQPMGYDGWFDYWSNPDREASVEALGAVRKLQVGRQFRLVKRMEIVEDV